MESYEVDTNTRVDFELFFDGSVLLESVTETGDAERLLRVSQRIVLPVAQSKQLYEQLKERFEDATDDESDDESDDLLDHLYDDTTLPEEPEEEGCYVTQNGILLTKYGDGDWTYRKYPYAKNEPWKDELYPPQYTNDWKHVVATIGDNAFPLKRITISDMMSIAAQQPCDPANIGDELETRLDALRDAIHEAAAQMAAQLVDNLTVKTNIEE